MPRKQKKYHYIYKTTNILNGKYYIGMHSTDDLDDGYIGSGKRLRYSVNKHGIENHIHEVLEFLPSRESLGAREAELVNEETLSDPLCINLKYGGDGGFADPVGSGKKGGLISGKNPENRRRWAMAHSKKLKTDPMYSEKFSLAMSTAIKDSHATGTKFFHGKSHTNETKNKMRLSATGKHLGSKNSQYGTCWINNGSEAKKIHLDELELYVTTGWTRGRKIIT